MQAHTLPPAHTSCISLQQTPTWDRCCRGLIWACTAILAVITIPGSLLHPATTIRSQQLTHIMHIQTLWICRRALLAGHHAIPQQPVRLRGASPLSSARPALRLLSATAAAHTTLDCIQVPLTLTMYRLHQHHQQCRVDIALH